MERIHQIMEKGKRGVLGVKELLSREDIYILLIILFVGFGGFGLGRLSKIYEAKTPVYIQKQTTSTNEGNGGIDSISVNDRLGLVASVNGAKYHLPWCSGATRIKEKNKIWFADEKEARAAGYTPAENCKGL